MDIVNFLLEKTLELLDILLPALSLPDDFYYKLDSAMAFLLGLIQGAAYFLPINVMISCFVVILIVDNFALMMRAGQFILKLIRG